MSLYAFHLGQIISTVLGPVDHGGQDGNAARTRIRGETSKQLEINCREAILVFFPNLFDRNVFIQAYYFGFGVK